VKVTIIGPVVELSEYGAVTVSVPAVLGEAMTFTVIGNAPATCALSSSDSSPFPITCAAMRCAALAPSGLLIPPNSAW